MYTSLRIKVIQRKESARSPHRTCCCLAVVKYPRTLSTYRPSRLCLVVSTSGGGTANPPPPPSSSSVRCASAVEEDDEW